MQLTYTLDKSDVVTYRLFAASQSKRFRQRRITLWLALTGGLLAITAGQYFTVGLPAAAPFAAVAVLNFALYPRYSSWRIRRRQEKHLERRSGGYYPARQTLHLSAEKNRLSLKDVSGTGKVKLDSIAAIFDIGSHIFLFIADGPGVILPKDQIPEETRDEFLEALTDATELGVVYRPDWKWGFFAH